MKVRGLKISFLGKALSVSPNYKHQAIVDQASIELMNFDLASHTFKLGLRVWLNREGPEPRHTYVQLVRPALPLLILFHKPAWTASAGTTFAAFRNSFFRTILAWNNIHFVFSHMKNTSRPGSPSSPSQA